MRVGSTAFGSGTKCSIARKARNEPARSFNIPGMIQPGPAARYAAHQARLPGVPPAGRNRRKSTCSPIWAINEKTTVAAVPNRTRSNDRPLTPAIPVNLVQRSNDALINGRDKDEGQEMQHDPCWLLPELKPADERDAMRHQRNHDQRAEHVAYEKWDAQTHL